MSRNRIAIGLLSCVQLVVLVGCNGGKNQTNIEVIQGMMDQVSIKSQEGDPENPTQPLMRVPPEGTVARGKAPYPFTAAQAFEAGKQLKNPLAGEFSPEVLEAGKKHFDIYCAVCHGSQGTGNGSVAEKMILRPPTLLSAKVRDFPDGQIFHVITLGQGLMGGYGSQIQDEKARWAMVNYVRSLQKSGANSTEK